MDRLSLSCHPENFFEAPLQTRGSELEKFWGSSTLLTYQLKRGLVRKGQGYKHLLSIITVLFTMLRT